MRGRGRRCRTREHSRRRARDRRPEGRRRSPRVTRPADRRRPCASGRRRARARRSGRAGRGRGSRGGVRAARAGVPPRAGLPRRPRTARARHRDRRAGRRRRRRRGWPRTRCARPERSAAGSRRPSQWSSSCRWWRRRGRTSRQPPREASIAPGSSFQSSFPGSVVPPPRRARRDSVPATRNAAVSRSSASGGRIGRHRNARAPRLAPSCSSLTRSTILACRGSAVRAIARIDPDALAGVPGGDPAALHRRAAPRGAPCLGAAARPVADDEGVRRRPGAEGASTDGDRALRHVERREARRRARCRDGSRRARSCSTVLRCLGEELGRTPTAHEISKQRRGAMPSTSLYWHTFGSLARRSARRASTSRSARSGSNARSTRAPSSRGALGRLPRFGDWARGAARRRLAPDRVAGLPAVRGPTRRLGDVPVPGARAARRRGRAGAGRRDARLRVGEPRRASRARSGRTRAPGRRAHRRERVGLDVLAIGAEPLPADDLPRPSNASSVPRRTSRLRSFEPQ